ncbi:sel1 repeat family protein [Neisseriaceae bacterium TC5R-5]|nr:sel1 repeat family protein [Neisseriaceae bacterium TC5R-5]
MAKPWHRRPLALLLAALLHSALLSPLLSAAPRSEKTMLLRNHIPPLFFPHRTEFSCVQRDAVVPPVSAEAEELLQQALLLEWNEMRPSKQTNWQRVIALTRQAAELGHWKAQLNLINLRLEGRGSAFDLPRDEEAALQELEAAMARGIPDAFDMMGRFYERGIAVNASSSKAYAFYQYAADKGSPAAQTFIGDLLNANYDDPKGTFWGNKPIGLQMLECAFAQGYGPAAFKLGITYENEIRSQPNLDAKEAMQRKAMRYFHEGTKMGHAVAAAALAAAFEDGTGMTSAKDPSRAERYWSISRSLDYYEPILGLKLPNLDKVLPLPPAKLPPWDGKRDSLVDAAKARQAKLVPPPGPAVKGPDARTHLPANYTLEAPTMTGPRKLEVAPRTGYWQAWRDPNSPPRAERSRALSLPPIWLQAGDSMPAVSTHNFQDIDNIYWQALRAVEVPLPPPPARQAAGYEIAVTPPVEPLCRGDQPCPKSGVWQARLRSEHPLASLVNQQAIRQAWVNQGESFPDPEHDWHLDAAADLSNIDLGWRLLEEGEALDSIAKA